MIDGGPQESHIFAPFVFLNEGAFVDPSIAELPVPHHRLDRLVPLRNALRVHLFEDLRINVWEALVLESGEGLALTHALGKLAADIENVAAEVRLTSPILDDDVVEFDV